ncbi:CGNR zinc finger domain-containing protein [Nocardia neocaledoniensis]|uniref:CGNR zinc finger domain-containing protein n=1 Tax=Nocardia neocaledoniensis TaxID=236511 RepID=UPI00245413F5|nr:CGNR zinc finger domain-containing protein [Nocardia neocaledoniensis]
MHYNHYGREPVQLGIELLNEPCASAAELAERCAAAGLVLSVPPTDADVTSVTAFLARWRRVIECADRPARADLLNALLAEYASAPRLTDHLGDGWHLHFRDPGVATDRQIAALITVGTALHLTGLGMDRLGVCQADGCVRVYADISRNGRQRFCSPACANRSAVRRHRAGRAVG